MARIDRVQRPPAAAAQPPSTDDGARLRQRAELQLSDLSIDADGSPTPHDKARLDHELRVHQIELEIQNEELRRAQAELEASRTRYFELYDLAPVGYITLTERGLIHEANLAAAKLLDTARQQLLRRPLSDWLMPEDQDIYHQARRRLNSALSLQRCELRLRRADGASLWIALALSLKQEPETGSLQYLVVINDIDAHKRLEALQREEAARKEDFLALLGHELRNPLAAIRHIAEVLARPEGQASSQLRPMAEMLQRQSGHLGRLVDDLLDLSRINRGAIRLDRAPCDLRECATNAVEQIQATLEVRGQHLDVALPLQPLVLSADSVRLTQAIVNLLRNASEQSPSGARIDLELSLAEGSATLEVRDQGAGLDPSALRRLLEPQAQLDAGQARSRGSLGMGLPLVRGLIELHDGTLEALSPGIGQGSTFRIRLPYQPGQAAGEASAAQPPDLPAQRILMVEDDPDVADSCALLLGLLGQEVEWAADGPAALAAVERFRPDLILLDLGLPGMDGFEVARRLRATAPGRTARLAALTGWGQAKDIDRTRDLGFDAHFTKPLDSETLIEWLGGRPGPASTNKSATTTETPHARIR
ncbi:response regulator [Thiorhodococcus mannitoliphagus]|uniref:histidine kinase n=1 Tax=Thiorhodococcus mannitoliphagus TaxID=329406 RepID=A0A6P1E5X2_9GAMM|nr:response regulator [Thiorhodococcus mannitoliphagus]NEX22975.1 response regulator [Thiorhodococcus mannitoliphagus]